jgi:hypothetical protein
MANMWSLWEDYEKRYNTWLKNSAVPATQSWYEGTGLEEKFKTGKEYIWGQTGTAPMGPESEGTKGLLGVKGEEPSFRGFQQSRTGQAIGALPEQAKQKTVGYPIGFGEGKVDPGLAAGVKSQYGIAQKIFSVEGRVGGEWKKKGIDLYNDIASEHFSKFAIRDKNGKIVKRDGKIQLNNEGKSQLDSAAAAFDKEQNLDLAEGGQGGKFTEQDASSLSKFAGVNFDDVKKNWAKKGGMDGLLANPAFTLGLALMQSSAQGKTVGSGLLDNFVKSAGLSEHYQDRLKARRNIMGPVSDDQRAMAASALPTGIMAPGKLESLMGFGDELRGHNSALNKVYLEVRKQFDAKDWDYSKGEPVMTEEMFNKAYNKLLKEKKISKVKGEFGVYLSTTGMAKAEKGKWEDREDSIKDFFKKKFKQFGGWINPTPGRAEGGPVQAGQPYVVGEKGPEVVIPKANANVVSNDDAQVMGMLLASNPQLQNVSKTRAESILRSRFPDYFA